MISPTLSTATATVAAPTVNTTSTAAETASDFETFLKMLTAQARYQDPLEPLDSSEYAAQLAQFSMVEQQVKSNDLLTALTNHLGGGNIAQMTSWIGLEARSAAPVQFDGSPLTLYPNPSVAADEMAMVVTNASGTEVSRSVVSVSAQSVTWSGQATDGTTLASGQYTIQFESRTNGELLSTQPAEHYARVTEARVQNGVATLILKGGANVQTSDVSALREPA